jgi:hypothetical protein
MQTAEYREADPGGRAFLQAWVFGLSVAGIGFESRRGMDVCLFGMSGAVRKTFLRRADPSPREVLPSVVCHRMWSGATITHYTYNKQEERGQTKTERTQGTVPANTTFCSACSTDDTVQYRPSVLLFTLFYYYLQYSSIFVSGNTLGIALPFTLYTKRFLLFF